MASTIKGTLFQLKASTKLRLKTSYALSDTVWIITLYWIGMDLSVLVVQAGVRGGRISGPHRVAGRCSGVLWSSTGPSAVYSYNSSGRAGVLGSWTVIPSATLWFSALLRSGVHQCRFAPPSQPHLVFPVIESFLCPVHSVSSGRCRWQATCALSRQSASGRLRYPTPNLLA